MKKILISMGDPAGIGPEVVAKCLAGFRPNVAVDITVVGELAILQSTASAFGLNVVFCLEDSPRPNAIKVRSLNLLRPKGFRIGEVSAPCGHAAYAYFADAAQSCLAGTAEALVTAPINKKAINLAGHPFVGHTDILEKMTGVPVVMALVHPKVIVSHVTDHVSLRQALDSITVPRIKETVKLTWKALTSARTSSPRIALAGVNPHAGEHGLFGREEIEVLLPAMEELRAEGYPTLGPFAGDTVFLQALQGRFDGVLAMYHDQGFGPMKTADFAHGVNCTLGLPFVRTSPDHGTAFEIAGRGIADPEPMISALNLAIDLLGEKPLGA